MLQLLGFGSADDESPSPGSSDDESKVQEAERRPAAVTSLDEALRRVNSGPEHEQEDFLRQNFETLTESCSTGIKIK